MEQGKQADLVQQAVELFAQGKPVTIEASHQIEDEVFTTSMTWRSNPGKLPFPEESFRYMVETITEKFTEENGFGHTKIRIR